MRDREGCRSWSEGEIWAIWERNRERGVAVDGHDNRRWVMESRDELQSGQVGEIDGLMAWRRELVAMSPMVSLSMRR